jgi:hypothetical protein
MTSSQEPQLTRREMRERERLQQEQAASPTPNPASNPVAPAPAVAPQSSQPAPVPVYAAPASTDGTQPGGTARPQAAPYGQQPSPYPTAVPATSLPPVAPLPSSSFAPAPAAPVRPTSSAPVVPAPIPVTPAPAAPAAPVAPAAGVSASTPERTLTRRELRAMLGGAAADDLDDVDDEIAGATAMQTPRAPAAGSFPPASAVGASTANAVPRQPLPHQEAAASAAEQPVAAVKPVGHWTSQLDAPVEVQPYDQVLSRGGVGRGVPTTTNALILPTLPDHTGIPAPLADNGEIIVTGSIDLPRSFGATGVHPSQIDSSDVDRLFDQVEDGATAGAPVSATRAISTQSAAKAVMAPPSKEGMNVPLVLAVTAGVLALGVVATLVVGALTGLF